MHLRKAEDLRLHRLPARRSDREETLRLTWKPPERTGSGRYSAKGRHGGAVPLPGKHAPARKTELRDHGKPREHRFVDEDGKLLGYRDDLPRDHRRKAAAEALAKARAKYRDIFENAVEGIYRSVPAGQYTDVNPAFARIFGYDSPEELITAVNDIGRQLYNRPGSPQGMCEDCRAAGARQASRSYPPSRTAVRGGCSNNVRAVRDSAQGNNHLLRGFYRRHHRPQTDGGRTPECTRDALERRIRERTAELAQLNETLRLDIESGCASRRR